MKKFHKTTSICKNDGYSFYRKHYDGLVKSKKISKREEWKKIHSLAWQTVKEAILEKESGVVLEGLGYFCIYMNPLKKKVVLPNRELPVIKCEERFNYHSEHHTYHPVLFTNIHKTDKFYCWSMERTFMRGFRKELSKRLKAGKKYALRFTTVRKIYKNANYIIREKTNAHK